jgi:hypothetical protein
VGEALEDAGRLVGPVVAPAARRLIPGPSY